MTHRRKSIRSILLSICLAVMITAGSAQAASASIFTGNTPRAINEYATWIVNQVKGYTGYNYLPYAPLRTYGKVTEFRNSLRRNLGDGRITDRDFALNYGFSTDLDATIFIWSLIYKNNPYVEYNEGTGWYNRRWYGTVSDDRINYYKYQHDVRRQCHAAVARMKADFKSQLSRYEKKYGRLTTAKKLSIALNYCADKMSYYRGWVSSRGSSFYTGGDMYSAFMAGKGVCFDYSTLFDELCKVIGVECHVVMGRVKFRSSQSWGYHQWNVVKLNGRYFYVDPTNDDMGSNTGINNRYNFFYPNMSSMYYSYNVYIIAS